MIAPKIIDKNTVTASNVTNTLAEVGRMRLRSSRRAEADKPVQEHKQVLKICVYSSNLSKYSPSTKVFFSFLDLQLSSERSCCTKLVCAFLMLLQGHI